MNCDVILTTVKNGKFIEKSVGRTRVTCKTDLKVRMSALAKKHFGPKHNVRRDGDTLFRFTAVAANGDTLHLQ
jgi:hypothetical protein